MIQDNTVATHLFRIAQEAVTNAIKHGKPGRIEISLTETPGRINLAVRDDGSGLPDRQRKKAGMGLRIMRYRAGMIGGSLAIQKGARRRHHRRLHGAFVRRKALREVQPRRPPGENTRLKRINMAKRIPIAHTTAGAKKNPASWMTIP